MPPTAQPVTLRIELLDVAPLVWRRVLVSNQWTLASLHNYLQWVMGWMDTHAHEFQVGAGVVAPDWWIHEVGLDSDTSNYRDERRVSVAAIATELGIGGEIEYRYDMGDGWQHRIVIEPPPPLWATSGLPLPACVAGENACPPDDVGGPHGYALFLEIIGGTMNSMRTCSAGLAGIRSEGVRPEPTQPRMERREKAEAITSAVDWAAA